MLFHIDFNAATALYRQLVDQVCYAAAAGTLKPKDPLPTIRPLAQQLHLNRNTVAKAYTELENLGVIKTIPGKGCFVEPVNTPFTTTVRDKLLNAKIDAALITAHQLQVDAAAFSSMVAERVKIFVQTKASEPAPPANKVRLMRTKSQTAPITGSESQPHVPSSPPKASASDMENWTPFTD